MNTDSPQWQEKRNIHKEHRNFYELAGGSTLVIILLIFGGYMFAAQILDDYTTNVFTEGLGVIATVLIVDLLNRRRAEKELKEQFIFELGSNEHGTAMRAFRLLDHKGWLQDGSLKGAYLHKANLEKADFKHAILDGVDLSSANLKNTYFREGTSMSATKLQGAQFENARFWNVNLKGARLDGAKLDHVKFSECDLSNTILQAASFREATLHNVNFEGADLWGTDFKGADLHNSNLARVRILENEPNKTQFDENTTLPDDAKWTPETDMTRYTDPDHPDFWQPDWEENQDE